MPTKKVKKKSKKTRCFGMFIDIWCEKKVANWGKIYSCEWALLCKKHTLCLWVTLPKDSKKVFNINAFFWHENNAQLSMKQMKFNMQYFV